MHLSQIWPNALVVVDGATCTVINLGSHTCGPFLCRNDRKPNRCSSAWTSFRPVCFDLAGFQRIAELVAVIAFIADQHLGVRHCRIDQFGSHMIRQLAFAQAQYQESSLVVAQCVKLGVQAALGSTNTVRSSPFFSRLQAVR